MTERRRRLPDFIGIGAQKAASTWLALRLQAHPDVWLPFAKELHYFDAHGSGISRRYGKTIHDTLIREIAKLRRNAAPAAEIARLEALDRPDDVLTWDWYLDVFGTAPSHAVVGEITPRYSTLPARKVADMTAALPDTRFIYILRDPVERAMSAYRMFAAAHPDQATLGDATEHWFETGSHSFGNYADFVPRWDAHLTEGERLLYLPFGRLRRKPNRVLRQVERFIGVRPRLFHRGAKRPANQTPQIQVPRSVEERLRDELAVHRIFLEKRFPAGFVADL